MSSFLRFSYRPDGRLNCPWPLSMVAFSLEMLLSGDAKTQEYLYQRQVQASSIARTHRIHQEAEHPDGLPDPVYPSDADNSGLYKWKWVPNKGSQFPEMILSMLWEMQNDQKLRARELFVGAVKAMTADNPNLPPNFERYDLFVVYGAKVLGYEVDGTEATRAHSYCMALIDIDHMIMQQPSKLGGPQEAILIVDGIIQIIRLLEGVEEAKAA